MLEILETDRLLLRPPGAGDIRHFVVLLGDYEVSKNLGTVPHPYTEDDGCAFVVKARDNRAVGSGYGFVVLRKSDGALIGACGVHNRQDGNVFQFGYWLGRAFWGQGYATEAAARIVAFGFEQLHAERLMAWWMEDNSASGRVLEKLGCRNEGTTTRHSLSRGCAVICHKMALTKADFQARRAN